MHSLKHRIREIDLVACYLHLRRDYRMGRWPALKGAVKAVISFL